MRRVIRWLDQQPGRVAEVGLATLIVFVIAVIGLAATGTDLSNLQNWQSAYQRLYETLGNAARWVGDTSRAIAASFR